MKHTINILRRISVFNKSNPIKRIAIYPQLYGYTGVSGNPKSDIRI